MKNSDKKKQSTPFIGDELDPKFADIIDSFRGNISLGELQSKIETYIDSRIDAKLKSFNNLK